jgi:hypothetical protein
MAIPISDVTRRVVYSGSAGAGPYSFSFEVLANTDIAVYKDQTLLTLTTDYSVSISANGTGNVTLVVAATAANNITLVGDRAIERTTDFVTGGDLFANSLNDELDSLVIFSQQVKETADRGLKAPITDPTDVNMELPSKTSRIGKTLAFDNNGNPTVGEDIGNWRGNWATGTSYTVRDLVKDPVNSNIYRVNTAHTSSGSAPISSNADSAKFDLVIDAASAADAEAAQIAAEAAQAAAEAAQSAAETAETNAAASESAAATSESNAASSESAAASSASNASSSASAASSSASAASTSASNAASSASAASTSASNAASSASAASTSETNAASSASAASTSASNASSSASAASSSASGASSSASAAASSAAAAATSETNAAAALASFNATYLGAQASDPANDNEGDPVTAGDWYFNTSSNISRIYDGSAWANVTVSAATVVSKTSNTGSAIVPSGTEAQRDGSPGAGYFRFNSDSSSFEGYNGSSWGSVGGGATGGGNDAVFVENDQVVTTNYTITTGKNASSAGPITIDSGATVTVPTGSRWLVL